MIKPFLEKHWTTYMGVLVRVLYNSEGDIVELGTGPFSTPLLHWVAKDMNRKLASYENNPEYYHFARQFRSYSHKVVFTNAWDEIDCETKCGLVFVDHRPESRRSIEAARFSNSADFVVIHDTENDQYYSGLYKHFKYIYIWKGCRPWTSILSNTKDLNFFSP